MGFERIPGSDIEYGLISFDTEGKETSEPKGRMSQRLIDKVKAAPFLTTFTLVFFAELGDKSQITAGLVAAQYASIIPVFLGTLFALGLASALIIFMGQKLSKKLPLALISKGVAVVFIALGALRLWHALLP